MDIVNRLQSLSKGETLVYHSGYLPDDRKKSTVVEYIATLAYSLGTNIIVNDKVVRPAMVHLTQKMLGEYDDRRRITEYRATSI